MRLHALAQILEEFAPPVLAADWDNVGLHAGDPQAEVTGVLLCLDVTHEHLAEASAEGLNLIVSHHPVIFEPLKSLRLDHPVGRLLTEAVRRDIGLHCVHTNLDVAHGGVSDALAARLGLGETVALRPSGERMLKLAVFVPLTSIEEVREAVCVAGAGRIGDYSYCTFRTAGTGSFYGEEGADPTVGRAGELTEVPEERLEVVVPERHVPRVIAEMKRAHPYEEVAYDLFPLENPADTGYGRVGDLSEAMPLGELLEQWARHLGLRSVAYVGQTDQMVRRVAVCGGSAGDLVAASRSAGADLLVAGELRYHAGAHAAEVGLALAEIGHDVSEHVILEPLMLRLRDRLKADGAEVPVRVAAAAGSPWSVWVMGDDS